MESLVSVIVPVYKVEKYLDETVSCLLKQTYRNLEIILVDDGSPDRCGEMCDEYARRDSRVKVIHKENGGLSSARNAGTEICTGDYIAYIDSDDVVSSDYIEYLLKLCGKHHVNMAICLTRDFQESGKPKFDYGLTWPESVLPRDMALKKFFYMDQIRTGVIGKLFSSTLKDSLYFHPGIYYEDARPMFQVLWRCDTVALGDAHKFGYRHRVDGITGQPDLSKDMDCVSEWNKIYRVVQKQGDHLLVAAASRYLSANAYVFFRITSVKKYSQAAQMCWNGIRKVRWTVLKDPHARKKAWFCALLSLSGMHMTHWIGRKILNK